MTFRTDLSATCSCCSDLLGSQFSRRRFIQGAAAAGAVLAMPAPVALAASGNYEAMVLGCIDPRLQEPMRRYTARRGLTGKFSQFIIAGAAIGVVAEPFKDWHKAFWDNLAASVQLHNIKRVIAIDHRDCGAAKIAYGADKVANPKIETETHRAALEEFRKQMAARQPTLKVETGLMAINGRMEMLG
jgi:carbonic anhydrase